MNDKIIINAISTIHFIIVSTIIFISILFSISFIVLQNGIKIDNITLENLYVERLYIKWSEKLLINAEEIQISKKKSEKKQDFSSKDIKKIFKKALLFDNWFQSVDIKKIGFNDINGSFKYVDGGSGFIDLSHSDFSLKASLSFEKKLLNIKVDKFRDEKRDISIDGNIIVDGVDRVELFSSLDIKISDEIELHSFIQADTNGLSYVVHSKKGIIDYEDTIDIANLSKEIKYWAYDAIKASKIDIRGFYGWLEYDKMDEAFTNLYVKLIGQNLNYIYHSKLEPIVSKKTEVVLKKGVLYIRPIQAYQYGFHLEKSWVKIDFTKKDMPLTIDLLFQAKLNKDILNLLEVYNIELPLEQKSGVTDVDLKLEIGLREIDIDVKGRFFTKKAKFDLFGGVEVDVFDATILLDNYDVTIDNMHSKHKEIAVANVDLKYDAKKNEGEVKFRVEDVYFKDIDLRLDMKDKPLKVCYLISQKQDTIKAEDSSWRYKGYGVNLKNLTMPFDAKTLIAKIPTTLVTVDSMATAYVSGDFLVNPIETNLDVDLLTLEYNNIKMQQTSTALKVRYDETLRVISSESIDFTFSDIEMAIDNTSIVISDKVINLLNSDMKIKKHGKLKLNAEYIFDKHNGTINIEKIALKNRVFGDIYFYDKNIDLTLKSTKNRVEIESKKLGINFIHKLNSWRVDFHSLAKLHPNSKLLQDYNITDGNSQINQRNNDNNIKFHAKIKYPYKIFVTDNKPVQDYRINGLYNTKSAISSININNNVNISIDNDITVDAKEIGMNIDEVLRYFKDREQNNKKKDSINLFLNATDSYIYISKDRHVISDSIKLQYFKNILSAQLKHQKGEAGFELEDKYFYLYGDGFNDDFMENLFALSKFKNGNLSFTMKGTTDVYDGLMYIKETTILDYKILNNVLAFLNTIPSLTAFSLPAYSDNGLEVENAYVKFQSKDDIFKLSDIALNSEELDIVGNGDMSFKHNSIDLKLNLKTDLGSNLAKIPIVGYILLGEDTISTSIEVDGKLDNPDVESLVVEDIIVAPFNILKRTLFLPLYLLEKIKNLAD